MKEYLQRVSMTSYCKPLSPTYKTIANVLNYLESQNIYAAAVAPKEIELLLKKFIMPSFIKFCTLMIFESLLH